jgi:hypothetical protein
MSLTIGINHSDWATKANTERQDATQFTTKIGGKTSLGPSYFVL